MQIAIPGAPHGKGRPRAARRGKHIALYTDAKTASYENLVKLAGQQAMIGRQPSAVAIGASIIIEVIPPASWSKTKRAAALCGVLRPTVKPDLDNVAKSILDALNGIAYVDDSQVVDLNVSKHYKEAAQVVVKIREVG